MKRKLISLIMALTLLLSFSIGCANKSNKKVEPKVKIWSTSVLEKIMRDDVYTNRQDAKLNIKLAKNEVEGAQFIISSEEGYKVDKFTIDISELSDGKGNTIPNKDVKIYLQKYINVTRKMGYTPTSQIHAGYVPDALLPFEKAVEYGENTVVGVNQGIYVTVETQPETKAGNYTAVCTVDVDGKKFEIPMNVTVWDFAISEENHVGSLFAIWQDELMYGELDSSDEMYRLYYEYLASYRCSPTLLLTGIWDSFSVEDYLQATIEAYNDPRISTFALPYKTSTMGKGPGSLDMDYIKSFIVAMVKGSQGSAELLDKAVYYFGALIDEPQYTKTFNLAHNIFVAIDQMEEEIIEELEVEGFFNGKDTQIVNEIKEKIRKIPNILTTSYDLVETNPEGAKFEFGECTFCPLFHNFEGYNDIAGMDNLELYQKLKEVNGSLWWYGCNGPCYPYPCYHIDDNLIGTRILGSMMYDYDIDGNLYWCANSYSFSNTLENGAIVRPSKPYEEAARNSPTWPTNGEGFLLYPGVDYGIKGPVGSIRLEAVRDGNEDYEYYYLLNTLTEELSTYYDMEITIDGMVQNLRDRIYHGVQYVDDFDGFFDVRSELASVIERCGEDSKLVINGITYVGDKATIEFLVNGEYAVKINGQVIDGTTQGQGKKYSYTITMNQSRNVFEIELSKDGAKETVVVEAGGKTVLLNSFDQESDASMFNGNDASVELSYFNALNNIIESNSLKAVITSTFDINNPIITLGYNPQILISTKENGIDVTKVNSLMFNVYNASGIDVSMRVYLGVNTLNVTEISNFNLKAGQWNSIKLEGVYQTNWSSLADTNYIILEFNNTVGNLNKEAMPIQTLYFDDFLYSEKEV